MSLAAPLPMDRVYLINPGQTIDVGDRTLTVVRPPAFDNPITTGLRDERSGIFFSSDCFGALLGDVPGGGPHPRHEGDGGQRRELPLITSRPMGGSE
jgi:hypothetical protein